MSYKLNIFTGQLDIAGGGGVSIGDAVGSGTPNQVLYVDSSGNLAGSNNFTFDPSINRSLLVKGNAGGGVYLGAYNATYGGIWSAAATPSTTNYMMVSDGSSIFINAPVSGKYVGIASGDATVLWLGGYNGGASYGGFYSALVNPASNNYALIASATITAMNAVTNFQFNILDVQKGLLDSSSFTIGNANVSLNAGLGVRPFSSSQVARITKGLTSQSGDLDQWQDVNANIMLNVDAAGRLRFQTATSGSTNEGSVWADSTQKGLQAFIDGIEQTLQGVIFTQTADQTVTNTVTETTILGSGVGTLTLPANFFIAGKTIRIKVAGVYSTPALGATATVKVKYGSTVLASVATSSLLGGASSLRFEGVATITCRTTGATGTVMTDGGVKYAAGVAGQLAEDSLNNGGATTTIDTTASSALDVTVTWDSNTTTRIAKSTVATVEVLN